MEIIILLTHCILKTTFTLLTSSLNSLTDFIRKRGTGNTLTSDLCILTAFQAASVTEKAEARPLLATPEICGRLLCFS